MFNNRLLVLVCVVIAPFSPSALGFASAPACRRRRAAAPSLLEFRTSLLHATKKNSPPTTTDIAATGHEGSDNDEIRLNGDDNNDDDTVISSSSAAASTTTTSSSLWSREESARQLTEFMAKAHEEKLRAIRSVEDAYRAEIVELKSRLERYENEDGAAIATTQARHSSNSYEFPATNKAMGEKIRAYQRFVADYIVKAQQEKLRAVSLAEEKAKERYEAIILELTRQLDEFKP